MPALPDREKKNQTLSKVKENILQIFFVSRVEGEK